MMTPTPFNECPFAKILRKAAGEAEHMSAEDVRTLLLQAAEVAQRSHDMLVLARETIENAMPKGSL